MRDLEPMPITPITQRTQKSCIIVEPKISKNKSTKSAYPTLCYYNPNYPLIQYLPFLSRYIKVASQTRISKMAAVAFLLAVILLAQSAAGWSHPKLGLPGALLPARPVSQPIKPPREWAPHFLKQVYQFAFFPVARESRTNVPRKCVSGCSRRTAAPKQKVWITDFCNIPRWIYF